MWRAKRGNYTLYPFQVGMVMMPQKQDVGNVPRISRSGFAQPLLLGRCGDARRCIGELLLKSACRSA